MMIHKLRTLAWDTDNTLRYDENISAEQVLRYLDRLVEMLIEQEKGGGDGTVSAD